MNNKFVIRVKMSEVLKCDRLIKEGKLKLFKKNNNEYCLEIGKNITYLWGKKYGYYSKIDGYAFICKDNKMINDDFIEKSILEMESITDNNIIIIYD